MIFIFENSNSPRLITAIWMLLPLKFTIEWVVFYVGWILFSWTFWPAFELVGFGRGCDLEAIIQIAIRKRNIFEKMEISNFLKYVFYWCVISKIECEQHRRSGTKNFFPNMFWVISTDPADLSQIQKNHYAKSNYDFFDRKSVLKHFLPTNKFDFWILGHKISIYIWLVSLFIWSEITHQRISTNFMFQIQKSNFVFVQNTDADLGLIFFPYWTKFWCFRK